MKNFFNYLKAYKETGQCGEKALDKFIPSFSIEGVRSGEVSHLLGGESVCCEEITTTNGFEYEAHFYAKAFEENEVSYQISNLLTQMGIECVVDLRKLPNFRTRKDGKGLYSLEIKVS